MIEKFSLIYNTTDLNPNRVDVWGLRVDMLNHVAWYTKSDEPCLPEEVPLYIRNHLCKLAAYGASGLSGQLELEHMIKTKV